ncbi:hypothetical protein VP1G_04159 [Cytospora mali]|uniref:Uncharacterized protein n=1 Tax=Cytospora mali TaxID=578113 RepID=A0A194UYU7_CYTMA|nr:hypothetical protein VP1G_04159 [Valsa mali var. pyri (nom. inval.)]
MAILNPVYGLIVPFLFVVTIPLAILAGITTTLAFSVLMFRVALVYIDIAVNMLPQYVAGRPVYPLSRGYANASTVSTTTPATSTMPPSLSPTSTSTSAANGSGHNSPTTARQVVLTRHHKRRRASAASFNSIGSITPTDDNGVGNGFINGGSKRNSFMMVPSSVGIDRDFEGVGGWRLNGKSANDDDDAWTHINSRLSLPLDHHWRHHHRSPSGAGTATPGGNGGEGLMMRSPSRLGLGWGLEERSPEHGSKKGRERREKDGVARGGGGGGGVNSAPGVSPNSSRVRTPTKVLPPLTTVDGNDGSYFPRVVSPRAEKRTV